MGRMQTVYTIEKYSESRSRTLGMSEFDRVIKELEEKEKDVV